MGFKIDFVESYDDESIVKELQRIAEILGRPNLSRHDIDSHGRLSSSLVIKRFGSLRKALQQARLKPTRFMKATDDELCSVLIQLWTMTLERFGRSPYRKELRDFGFSVSSDTFVRRFGSWNKALLTAAESVCSADGEFVGVPQPEKEQHSREGRKSLSVRKRFLVFRRDRYRCRLCGRSGVELEVDHLIPASQGGSDAVDNLQTLCWDCNRGKRDSFE